MADASLAQVLAGEATRFRAGLADAVAMQASLLASIVERNKDTAFGRQHAFASIDGPGRFAEQVPVRGYEALEPWIARAAAGDPAVLTAESVLAFEDLAALA